jgi:hypothetical protein
MLRSVTFRSSLTQPVLLGEMQWIIQVRADELDKLARKRLQRGRRLGRRRRRRARHGALPDEGRGHTSALLRARVTCSGT